jgi:mxaK protein
MAISLKTITVKHISWALIAISVIAAAVALHQYNRIKQVDQFNADVLAAKNPQTDKRSYQALYSTAYWLAKKEIYKESTLLFTNLTQKGTPTQRAAVYHNIGNMFFHKALRIHGNNTADERDEIEYMLNQAHGAYKQALKLDNSHWGTRRNLDRVISRLPETPTPGVGQSDSPGLIMGNIPVGLP